MRFPSILWATGAVVLCQPVSALEAVDQDLTQARPIPRGTAMLPSEGGALALGPGYKATLEAGRVRFVPALGQRTERNRHIEIAFESVWRESGGSRSAGVADLPQIDGSRALFGRGGGVTERWIAGEDGLELGFVLERPLAGSGDLVLRLDLDTDLELPLGVHADGLTLNLAGEPAARIGDVTAVDAAGWTVSGSLATDGEHLDLVIPAHFADGAQWPIDVDPVFSGLPGLSLGIEPEGSCISYLEDGDQLLYAWRESFSFLDIDLRGQRVDAQTGAAIGPLLPIEVDPGVQGASPAVASVSREKVWMVAYAVLSGPFGDDDVFCRTITNDGGMSPAAVVADGTAGQSMPDIGASSSDDDSGAIVVWHDFQGIKALRLLPQGAGSAPSLETPAVDIFLADDCTRASISRSGGSQGNGQFFIAWQRFFGPSPFDGDHDLYVRAVDRDLNLLSDAYSLNGTATIDEQFVHVDSYADVALVTFMRQPTLNAIEQSEVRIRALRLEGGAIVDASSDYVLSPQVTGRRHYGPQVACTGHSWEVAYLLEEPDGEQFMEAWSLDYYRLHHVRYFKEPANFDEFRPEPLITTRFQTTGEAHPYTLFGWPIALGGGAPDAQLMLAPAPDAFPERLETGCALNEAEGRTGTSRLGRFLDFRLENAPPATLVYFLAGVAPFNLPCNSCVIVPDYTTGLLDAQFTDMAGEASFISAVVLDPALEGLPIYSQWAVSLGIPLAGSCNQAGFWFHMTDAHLHTVNNDPLPDNPGLPVVEILP